MTLGQSIVIGIYVIGVLCAIIGSILLNISPKREKKQNFIHDMTESDLKSFLEKYMQSNEPKNFLENSFCLIFCDSIDDTDDTLYIKVIDKKRNKFFNIQGDKNIVSTIYAAYQAFFCEEITYNYVCTWTLLRYSNAGELVNISGDFV